MPQVETVTGPVDSEDLGFTLMHEHLVVTNWSMRQGFADYLDTEELLTEGAAEVRKALGAGVRTMVDLTPINLGRDVTLMRQMADLTGIQVIAATGYYWTEEPWMEAWPVEHLSHYLVRDIQEGVQGTDIKAGVIKCATDRLGVTELNRKLLEVAADAHRKTGVPISTHTSAEHEVGLIQQDVFEGRGVDLRRVVIGHCGDSQDLDYLEKILRRGSTIGMDRFGIDMILPLKQRVETVAELCKRGYAGQMVVSHDANCSIDWFPNEAIREAAPQWNFSHISQDVIPALHEAGVSEGDVRAMTVENPRRFFEQQGAY